MSAQLVLAAAAFALLAQILYSLVRWIRSPLRSVPGPSLARFTDFWYFRRLKQGGFEKVNQRLHERYGPIVRYGPNRYSINDAEALKTIYGHGTEFQKSEWYISFQPNEDLWNLFSERSAKRHARNRRFYTNAYSMTSLISYEPYVDECGALFAQRLSEFSKAGATIDIGHWSQCYAFDTIALMTYGKRLGFLDRGEDVAQVIDNLSQSLVYMSLAGIFPFVHMYITPILNKVVPGLSMGAKLLYILSFTAKTIEEEKASPKPIIDVESAENSVAVGEAFLTKFLAKHSSNTDEFTQWHLLNGCMSNMVAGSDTTGISISAILYNLLKNPDTMAKLREELADFTSRGELSQSPTFKESQKMPYLQAVIKEALRVHPAVGLPLERIVPAGGVTIAGCFFPAGSVVGINGWVQHRNKAFFGEDADSFNPNRWLIEDEKRLSVMNRNWMPFGLGSRTCIGKNVSILEISKLIPRIIRDFDFKLEGDAAAPAGTWKTHNACPDYDVDANFDLPTPPADLPYSKANNIICTVVMTLIGLSAVTLGARDAQKQRTLLPLILPLSGAMIAFPETFIDVLGCIYYPWPAENASFHLIGREMPPWIPIWFGYGSLMQINLQLLVNNASTKTLWRFLGLMMVSDLVVEEILLPMGVYHYYGNQPLVILNMFPWWWMAPNSIGVFLATALAYRYRPLLVGWKVVGVMFLTPMSVGAIYGFICFPVWVAINGDCGWLVTQLLGLLTMAFGFVAFCIILEMVLGRRPFDMGGKEERPIPSADSGQVEAFQDEC
ncbi:hypothetical protein K4K56_007815 [Colletotrichum sp. SAR 10_98]|nr:hypothetical protein K4K56_007815 [Colletotrichum sp. SAR 10_98]